MEFSLIFHGIIVLFISVVGGFAFSRAIQYQPEREVAWRVVHSGGSMAGVMLMAFGGIWPMFQLKDWSLWFGLGLLSSTYLLVIGMFIAAITGKRGLSSKSSGIEKVVFIFYGVGGFISSISLGGLILFLGFNHTW